LEPEGIVEIKFRKEKVLALMDRLDETYRELKASSLDSTRTPEEIASLKAQLAEREKQLWPTYSQVALHFADLHDRPNRMKAKGTIREALEWTESRKYFYWRLHRRLLEEDFVKKLGAADPALSRAQRLAAIQRAISSEDESIDIENDEAVAAALAAKPTSLAAQIKLAREQRDRAVVADGLKRLFPNQPEAEAVRSRVLFDFRWLLTLLNFSCLLN
jgi:acetyl-CoA carboxylase/biotin carboxylase 1